MTLGIHGHIAITSAGGQTVRLNVDPTDYQPYGPIRRASRFRLLGGTQAVQDFGAVIPDGQITLSGVKVTQAVAKSLDAFYRADDPTYTIRDWAGHVFTAFFADLTLKPQIQFLWGPDRTATGADASSLTFDANAVPIDDYYSGANVRLTDGAAKGDARKVASYAGSTRIATMDRAWSTPPASGVKYQISDILHEVNATFWILSATQLFEATV